MKYEKNHEEVNFGGIPGVVVDPHNEVLGYWFDKFNGKQPGVLLHIDAHSDNLPLNLIQPNLANTGAAHNYARSLNCASFISAASIYDLVKECLWINPYQNNSTELVPSTTWIPGTLWINNKTISLDGIKRKIEQSEREMILDVDLDAFDVGMVYDSNPRTGRRFVRPIKEISSKRKKIIERIDRTTDFLSGIKKPSLVTIARSQTPIAYIHPDIVNFVQAEFVKRLHGLYGENLEVRQ